jgi:hypothetical protein
MLSGMKRQLVSEVKFGIPNACSGRCHGEDVGDYIVHNCLRARGYPITRDGLRQAFLDGYASVIGLDPGIGHLGLIRPPQNERLPAHRG